MSVSSFRCRAPEIFQTSNDVNRDDEQIPMLLIWRKSSSDKLTEQTKKRQSKKTKDNKISMSWKTNQQKGSLFITLATMMGIVGYTVAE